MMRFPRPLLVAAALVAVLVSGTARAAEPATGTLSKSKKSVKWSGSFTASQPDSVGACFGGATDPICDHFMLKLDLRDGARVKISLPAPDATADIDIFVFSPQGSEVGRSTDGAGADEVINFRHSGRFRGKVYEVRIKPWLVVPGTSYTATATVS